MRLPIKFLKMATNIASSVGMASRFLRFYSLQLNKLTSPLNRPIAIRHIQTKGETQKDHQTEEAKSDGTTPTEKDLDSLSEEIKKLTEEKTKLESTTEDIKDKYMRSLAENENIRKRLMRQIEEAKIFGIQKFCKDLLDVADVLNKATGSVPQEELNNSNPHLKSLYEGLKMTDTQLQKVFRLHGLTQINPVGEKFNPNEHEALFEDPNPNKPAGTVSVVTKIGYKLNERTIRPALVGVVKST